ncbi:MAG: DUF167 family protein [Candidatus Nitricoxidivorans perseverans]|uniref:UPF0235 protein OHM77_07960 n=1 Tax=Candidatus Nitricoxidivorans perseverans TaxID=2975601 RepID=A0AA49FJ30_9PROT|nr:MAG: DUF167 family protein [Candidatus Nitricoxidivorans perseverans]
MTWVRPDGDGAVLSLHIQPGAKKTEIVGLHGDALKIRLAAPPVDGKANAALLEFIAKKVGAGRSAVELASGEASRAKRVRIFGLSAEEVRARLQPKAPS